MGDRSYLPMLLRVAKRADNSYLQGLALKAFGELGGDETVPRLLPYLKSKSASERANALWALSRTGSRRAVPALIKVIRVDGLAGAALGALQVLTHKRLKDTSDPETAYQKWRAWWKTNGQAAMVFGPASVSNLRSSNECRGLLVVTSLLAPLLSARPDSASRGWRRRCPLMSAILEASSVHLSFRSAAFRHATWEVPRTLDNKSALHTSALVLCRDGLVAELEPAILIFGAAFDDGEEAFLQFLGDGAGHALAHRDPVDGADG